MESYHYQQLPLLSSPQPSSSWPQTNHIVNTSSTLTTTTTQNPNPKERRNGKRGPGIKLSTDPQSVAARHRRHRISDRFRILKSLVPGGSKMDTVSMLEEAITYVKFLKTQICWLHQAALIVPPPAAAAAAEETTAALTLPSNYNYNDAAQASIYSSYDCSDNLIPTHHHQEMLSYSFPPSPPPLPSFPNSSYQGGEDMPPNVSFIYYDEHYLD